MSRTITNRMLQKLSMYLIYLKGLPEGHPEYISATMIAEGLNMGEVNVRKDLAAVTRRGCPKCGRRREELISDLEGFLGWSSPSRQFTWAARTASTGSCTNAADILKSRITTR